MAVNRDKPDRWKADVAASVDFYNQWFLAFAPQTFREARAIAAQQVRQTIDLTRQMKTDWWRLAEDNRQQRQTQLDRRKSDEERNRLGQFATPRHLRHQTLIEADEQGNPQLEPSLVLLDCVLPKPQLAEQYPDLYHYILQGEEQKLHQRYLLSRRDPWYRQEERRVAPILCGYMARKSKKDGKSIRFYRNKSQAIAANVYLMLYPRLSLTQYYHQELELFLDQVFEQLLALDRFELVHRGRTYGGGLEKIEPKELGRVILPHPHEIKGLFQALNPLLNL